MSPGSKPLRDIQVTPARICHLVMKTGENHCLLFCDINRELCECVCEDSSTKTSFIVPVLLRRSARHAGLQDRPVQTGSDVRGAGPQSS